MVGYHRSWCRSALCAPIALLAFVTPGVAQTEPLEEIVVTARQRAERLQNVPDSITAFGATQIEERRMHQIDDVLEAIPNVFMVNDQDAGTNIITIRGIGTNRNLASSVAFVVDGVILPDSDAFTADMSDVERVEVLKGPQGALYGRNAIAGVISLVTKRPSDVWEGNARAGYSSGDTVDLFGAVSGPLVENKVAARFTAKYQNGDGTIRNLFDGEGLDHAETKKATARVIFTPTDKLSLDLRASYFDEKSGAAWYATYDVLGTTGGRLTPEIARTRPNQDGPHGSERTIRDLALVAEYMIDAGTFTSITAYDDIDMFFQQDLDYTPQPIVADARQSRQTEGFSQELRFTSDGSRRFRYIVGAYYQRTNRDVTTVAELDFCFLAPLPFCATPPGVLTGNFITLPLNTTEGRFRQYAAFAQSNYDITDTLELTLALRYDRDEREQLDVLLGRTDEAAFKDLQPKVSLAWQAQDNLMLYATYAEGYKSGAFNPPPQPTSNYNLVVEQEGTQSYEAGVKSTLMNGRLLLNSALYYTDYTNPQIFQLDLSTGGQVAINANAARIWGWEAEVVARPMTGLNLNAAFGLTRGEFKDFNGTGLYDGNVLPNMPEYSLNIGAQYSFPVADFGGMVRVDYARVGRIYFAEDNTLYQPSYNTVDAQIALEGESWTVALWGKNIFSEDYVTSAFSRAVSPLIHGSLGVDVIQTDPGTLWGVELRVRF